MRVDEVREKNNEELQQEMDESYRELMNLRFRWATHQLSDVNEMKVVKKTIARIHTVLREREMGIR
jgi:large subunit ribosomal protein L29